MHEPKVGLVAVASEAESGGDRAETLLKQTVPRLEKAGLEVVAFREAVWSSVDAKGAIGMLQEAQIDLLVIMHCTWVMDYLQFQLVKGIDAPVMLWALPYPETYSLASVQHFGSVLWHNDIFYRWVYGLPGRKG